MEYASIQAILYGPYLLAGLTDGDWDIKTESPSSLSDWITPIPAVSNSQLVSLCQGSGDANFVLSNSNQHDIPFNEIREHALVIHCLAFNSQIVCKLCRSLINKIRGG